jgi:hypothetical protein
MVIAVKAVDKIGLNAAILKIWDLFIAAAAIS